MRGLGNEKSPMRYFTVLSLACFIVTSIILCFFRRSEDTTIFRSSKDFIRKIVVLTMFKLSIHEKVENEREKAYLCRKEMFHLLIYI